MEESRVTRSKRVSHRSLQYLGVLDRLFSRRYPHSLSVLAISVHDTTRCQAPGISFCCSSTICARRLSISAWWLPPTRGRILGDWHGRLDPIEVACNGAPRLPLNEDEELSESG